MSKRPLSFSFCVVAASLCVSIAAQAAESVDSCAKVEFVKIGDKTVWQMRGAEPFFFRGGLMIDADGAPNAYHPDNRGIDWLANAGKPGNWWGIVTSDGTSSGTPVVQGADDPNPGYYVSSTSLADKSKKVGDPRRYVDSNAVHYVAVPPGLLASKLSGGVKLGDFVAVVRGGTVVYAEVADVGPRDKLGEGSIALAEALGAKGDPKKGGLSSGVSYVFFPGSGNRTPRGQSEIDDAGKALFEAWGGTARIDACLGK